MKRECISGSKSVENILYKILTSELPSTQTYVSTVNAVVGRSSPIHTQLSAVHKNNDIG